MTVNDVCRRIPLPIYYKYRPEEREAIRLWAQRYAARLDFILATYILAPAAGAKH
jgi:hypothetical protein